MIGFRQSGRGRVVQSCILRRFGNIDIINICSFKKNGEKLK